MMWQQFSSPCNDSKVGIPYSNNCDRLWYSCRFYLTYIHPDSLDVKDSRWRHHTETFSVLLALCAGNSPATGEFHSQRPVMRSFDVFFDLCLNKRLSKQSWCWWFEKPWRSLWRHCNVEWIQSCLWRRVLRWRCIRDISVITLVRFVTR